MRQVQIRSGFITVCKIAENNILETRKQAHVMQDQQEITS